MSEDIREGWKCPNCGEIVSPYKDTCPSCSTTKKVVEGTDPKEELLLG